MFSSKVLRSDNTFKYLNFQKDIILNVIKLVSARVAQSKEMALYLDLRKELLYLFSLTQVPGTYHHWYTQTSSHFILFYFP